MGIGLRHNVGVVPVPLGSNTTQPRQLQDVIPRVIPREPTPSALSAVGDPFVLADGSVSGG
jgi:hypothetical protein